LDVLKQMHLAFAPKGDVILWELGAIVAGMQQNETGHRANHPRMAGDDDCAAEVPNIAGGKFEAFR
jgi:hypothetical protein